jgi:hypothetical protein
LPTYSIFFVAGVDENLASCLHLNSANLTVELEDHEILKNGVTVVTQASANATPPTIGAYDPEALRAELAIYWAYAAVLNATNQSIWGKAYISGGGSGRGICAASTCFQALKARAGAPRDDVPGGRERRRQENARQVAWLKDIAGDPFRRMAGDSSHVTRAVDQLAQAIYADRAFDRLPILADALEDAGCTNQDILNHCRQPGEHCRGCWVVDLLLGKE